MAAVIVSVEIKTEPEAHRSEIDVALEAWGRWARSALSGIGWSPISLLARVIEYGVRGAAQSAGVRILEIDSMCELVDKAILRLDETQREVILRTYLTHEPSQITAQKCGLTYGYYRNVLSKARMRIGDMLFGAQKALCHTQMVV